MLLQFDTLTISPLESTIQIFLMHSSLARPSFSMAMVISSAIPIAAWRGRTEAKTKKINLSIDHNLNSPPNDPLLCRMFRQHEQLVDGPHAHTSPAPWNTMVWSHILLLVMRSAARSPATATAAVPEGHLRIDLRHFYRRDVGSTCVFSNTSRWT